MRHHSTLTPDQYPMLKKMYCEDCWTPEQLSRYFHCRLTTILTTLRELQIYRKNVRCNQGLREDYFDYIDTPIKAYFLGLLLTDGSITPAAHGRQASLALELVETDRAILDLLLDELHSRTHLSYGHRKNRIHGTYTLRIRSDRLVAALAEWNIIPNKTYSVITARIPEAYPIDFLRGFVDGDGSIYFSQNSWHFNICGHSCALIAQIATAISALDGQNANAIQVSDNVYRHTWNGQAAIRLLKILYPQDSTCVITRKMEKAQLACEDNDVQDIV